MWAVSTRTGVSGVEINSPLWCSLLLLLRGVTEEIICWFLPSPGSAAFGRTSCAAALSMAGGVRRFLLLTQRWGRNPGLCVSSLIPHQPSSGRAAAEWEQHSDMGDGSVKDWESSYAGKMMIGLVDLKKQLKKRWQFESTESNEWMV